MKPNEASAPRQREVVGVMTGTSIDGIDAALVCITGQGLEMAATLTRHVSTSLGDLKQSLKNAADQQQMSAGEFSTLAWQFGKMHARVIGELLKESTSCDLICIHGQTVFHQPPVSWQLVNAAPIAERFRCPVVFDLRQADLAAGGQGAPITPIADWILFRDATKMRAIINLGGFCNITILPAGRATPNLELIRGFDVCACNHLLDAVAREALNQPFDEDGRAALSGQVSSRAVEDLRRILDAQHLGRRSLGTGDEAVGWLARHRGAINGSDLAASAVEAVSVTIAEAATRHGVDELILAGGGARNRALIQRIAANSKLPTRRSDELGVPIEAREAMCFAVLGALCADGVSITLPHVTGCKRPAPVSGAWCSTRGPAR